LDVFGQDDPVIAESENTFVKELRRNEPRPKFFEFKYAGVENFDVRTSSEEFPDSRSTVDLNKRISLKLRAPLLLKPKFNLLLGIHIKREFFEFQDTQPAGSPFFSDFSRQFLSNAGMSLILKKNITEDKFYYAFWNGSLNSDELGFSDFRDKLKTSVVFIYVKNINAITQIGYGGGFGYIFGGASVFPVFIYNKTFTEKWNLEMMLPKSLTMRYSPMPETYVMFKVDVDGASYFIKNQPIEGYNKLNFQRSAVNAGIYLEREIYDFIWFGVSAGYNFPINIYLSEPRKPRREGIVILEADPAPMLSFSLFVVVPKKIYYKRGKQR
jgi:hypothetical protein